ncbi:PREDICTED: glutamate-rich protein 6B-like [Amphimedon queenslandica]|uniref:FAM194 C-terminal domain-containing protein n=1 Tax=Amphimedon queenslandica TaxID=400682 RepID=A0A1X7TUA8_AMPQE|nr:PREDICTED: glutamate-rich protein 6B-like [Amphimedon queenslandica]|eukprot:XP_019857792.1 PREDICTED: glutamate-rich protein 6B-like [Amphimedon queenslandica]
MPVVLPLPSIPIDDAPPDDASCGYIDKICYSSGQPLSVILPDNTGQVYYPSDNLALLQVTLHPSINVYLIFKDSKRGDLIGYVDDYGRGWVKGDYSIRFLSTLHEGFLFDNSGRSKTWVWSDSGTYSLHLPLVFRLNQYLTIKYNNHDDISITLTAQQKQHKIQIKRVVTMAGTGKPAVDKTVKYYNKELEKMTHRFNSHLSSFQQSIKLYNSSGKSKVLPPINGSRTIFKRARNSSVGTVTFQQ